MSVIGSSVTQAVAATAQAQRTQTERADRDKQVTQLQKNRELDRVDVRETEAINPVHSEDEQHQGDQQGKRRRRRTKDKSKQTLGYNADADNTPRLDVQG